MKKTVITSLTVLMLSNAALAGVLDQKTEDEIGNAFGSSFLGGIILGGTFGAGAAGLALANSAMVLGITLAANGLSSTTADDKSALILKEAINKEAAFYQINGEMGAVLTAGVLSLKNDNPELSDNEAVDSLVTAIN